MLRVHLFGGLSLAWDQAPLPMIRSQTARSLFAYLITYRNQPHTRDLLIGTFWPDLSEATARRRLSKALWQIRQRLLPVQTQISDALPIIITEGDTIQLNPHLRIWLDVAEFTKYSNQCQSESTLAVEPCLSCIAQYRGEFLAGYHDDWAVIERERLRDIFLLVLAKLAAGLKSQGDYDQALRYTRRLVEEDPWREDAHREAMRLYHLLGQDAAALNQFEVCRRILADELGIEPSPTTTALAAEIATFLKLPEPQLLPSAARPVAAPHLERPDQLPLVGRREELAELLYQAEAAMGGCGGLIVIYGEAGVGKSRLMRELAQNGRWRGMEPVWGRCSESVTPLPYLPLIETLRASLPILIDSELEPLWRAELSRLLPELAVATGLPPSLSPLEEKRRLLEALTRAFSALSKAAPHLVLLEDMHWMDPASLELLSYLLPRLANTRLLFVGTVRPEELAGRDDPQQPAAVLAAMSDTRLLRRLDLKRFNLVKTEELIRRLLGMSRPAPRFSARLFTETEGNPFFLIETLWAMIEEGSLLCQESGEWFTPWDEFTEDYTELPLPAGVLQSIERRLERLPPALRDILDLAAVIGRNINFELWQTAYGRPEQALLTGCKKLCARGLLLPADTDLHGGNMVDYSFAHDQIRRVAYQKLAPPRRRAYHSQVAQALSVLAPDSLEALADHWLRAEVWPQAAACHQQAGDRARKIFANSEALAHYTQALTALERIPGLVKPTRTYQLHQALEAIYDLLGQREPQLASLQAMETAAESLGGGALRAETVLRRANYAEVTGDYDAAVTAVQQAIQLSQSIENIQIQAVGFKQWGGILLSLGKYTAAGRQFEHSLTLARAAKSAQLEADILRNLGLLAYHQGEYEDAVDIYRQALTICLEIGDKRGEGRVRNNLALVAWSQGNYHTAVEFLEQASLVYREVGDRRNEGSVILNIGRVYLEQHKYGQANIYLNRALDIFLQAGDRQAEGWVRLNLGRAAFLNGEPQEAKTYCHHALEIFAEIHVPLGKALVFVNLGGVYRQLGEFDQAKSYLQEALGISRSMGDRQGESWGTHYLANVLVDLGDYQGALIQLTQALKIATGIGDRRGQGWALADISALSHYLSDNEGAREQAQKALLLAQQLEYPLLEGVALLRLGRALGATGQGAEAEKVYQEALALLRPLKAKRLALSALSGLATLALMAEDPPLAQTYAAEILDFLKEHPLYGIEEPFEIYLICHLALKANKNPQHLEVLATAYELLQAQAAKIGDEALRNSYLENVAAHKQIVIYYQEQLLPSEYCPEKNQDPTAGKRQTMTIALPQLAAPRGRPLREDEYVTVTWTIAAPEDEAISGKKARRRYRLRRLLREAQAQGAAPTYNHLAEALEVSRRTIERDMADLRHQD